jgi:RteC protein
MTRHHWEKHYEALISSQEDCMRLYKTPLERLECCFLESFTATDKLVRQTLESGFKSIEEEIYFFKVVKPKFASQMIFFRLLYHNTLFAPKDDIQSRVDYWKREGERLSNYIIDNQDFYEYWKSGCSEKDPEYFVQCERKEEVLETIDVSNILYQTKEAAGSSHDNQVATFLALEKYEQFVAGKLATIYSQEN